MSEIVKQVATALSEADGDPAVLFDYYLEHARTAIEAVKKEFILTPRGSRDEINEILKPYRALISATPELLSLLYDIDMMPEQTATVPGAIRLAALCEVWKRGPATPNGDRQ